jgi:tetratricopeptide (TPR) repeat protein
MVAGTMTIDLNSLWEFNDPKLSEQRFRAAITDASADDVLILETQIARTYGLRRDFTTARQILSNIEPQLSNASAEVTVRFYLESGRTYASATHTPAENTAESTQKARNLYLQAIELAQQARLDALAIDALHMLAFVEAEHANQLEWTRQALAIATTSDQPLAQNWEASLRNNCGYALHQMGQYEEALKEFETAVILRKQQGNAENIRVARWMVAWTLRSLNRIDEALQIQLQLERELEESGESDPYVFAELEQLYSAQGNSERAAYYAQLRR